MLNLTAGTERIGKSLRPALGPGGGEIVAVEGKQGGVGVNVPELPLRYSHRAGRDHHPDPGRRHGW